MWFEMMFKRELVRKKDSGSLFAYTERKRYINYQLDALIIIYS